MSLLSVVVPAHDVSPYIGDCLASIAAQTHRDLEVVVVDDGSTDGTGDIAADFARRDSRFRLISQDARGPGAARNAAIRAASGEFLTFVDGDDLVPPYAFTLALAALERTGSDLACGDVRSLSSLGASRSGMHRVAFRDTRLRTHLTSHLPLLRDRTVWNKVYRRRFWDEHGLVFPEGVVFEDVPVALMAHAMASSVDVLNVPLYYWRRREMGKESITQRRTDWPTVADRFAAVERVSRFFAEHGQEHIKRAYDANVLSDDLALVLDALPDADADFRAAFLDRANAFLDGVDTATLDRLNARYRVQWHLARRRMMPELLEVALSARKGVAVPVLTRGSRRFADLPFLNDATVGVPRDLYRLPEPPVRSAVHEVAWHDGRLRIRGHAYIEGTPSARPWSSARLLWLREQRTRRAVVLPTTPRRCADATAEARQERCSYEWSGFEVSIDPADLRDGDWKAGTWALAFAVAHLGGLRKHRVSLGPGSVPLPPAFVDGDVRVVPTTSGDKLELRVEEVRARVTACRLVGEVLEVEGQVRGESPTAGRLQLCRVPGVVGHSAPVTFGDRSAGWTAFQAELFLADVLPEAPGWLPPPGATIDRWRIVLAVYSEGRRTMHLVAPPDLSQARIRLRGHEVYTRRTEAGYAWLCARPAGPVATELDWRPDGTLVVAGDLPADDPDPEIVLRLRELGEIRPFAVSRQGGRWRAELAPAAIPAWGGTIALRPGSWDVLARRRVDGRPAATNLTFADALLRRLPERRDLAGRAYAVEPAGAESAMVVAGPVLRDSERGAYARGRMRSAYRSARSRPRRNAVLFESFGGRQYSDSPRAVHEELLARGIDVEEQLWTVRDGQVGLPATARPVRYGGPEWYEALASCRYIVTNSHLPDWFERAPGQTVAQLWHGTPLKRIGFDAPEVRHADRQYLSRVARETPHWTFLVSPNRFSTPVLRRAFRYSGEILEAGYPRNDVLYRSREPVAAAVRRRLGLPAGRKVLLYAPTWRDDQFHGAGRYRFSSPLDLDETRRALGADHVLLVRRHPNQVDEIPGTGDGFVWDVSTYPDMADLLVVADVLITDYSSAMFDFANTGRPMLFFTYDLDHYRDNLRGFYVDFEAEAPGPLLSTSAEVIDAVKGVGAVAAAYAARYERFIARFCDLDDGKATGRVVDRLLG